jgi:hypothetical protein
VKAKIFSILILMCRKRLKGATTRDKISQEALPTPDFNRKTIESVRIIIGVADIDPPILVKKETVVFCNVRQPIVEI